MTRPANYQQYRGERQIARILAAVANEPMTARELAAHVNLHVSSVLIYTQRLMAEPRQLRVAAYAPCSRGKPAPMYGPGDAPDVDYIGTRKPRVGERLEKQRARVLAAMASPCTAEQLGVKLSLTVSRARVYIRELRKAKQAYIQSWASPPARGDLAPVYALGSKADKPKPRQSRALRYKLEKADQDRHDRNLAKRRARYDVAKAVARPNTWLSALGVPAVAEVSNGAR
jgi:predicted ArsR family transcriptional regulator